MEKKKKLLESKQCALIIGVFVFWNLITSIHAPQEFQLSTEEPQSKKKLSNKIG